MKIAVLPGDGIGLEIITEALKVLNALGESFEMETAPVGGAGYEAKGHPLPEETLKIAKEADAILFGAVGDFKYDTLARELRPEQAILGLRKHLGLFANLRPAICYPELTAASSLKPELVAGLNILIVRELNGDIYFGSPKGIRTATDGLFPGAREGFDTMRYSEPEVERIAHVAFQAAQKRQKRLCSVDKSNVLETFQLWKDVMIRIGKEYPDVELTHMYVDNAAMQLVKAPKAFDVVVTGNMFGDIFKEDFDKAIELMPNELPEHQSVRNYLIGIKNQSGNTEANLTKIEKLYTILEQLDQRRNTNWRGVYPWLVKLFQLHLGKN